MNPERRYRNRVEKHLPEEVYFQAMGGTATSGTPDSYYEALGPILWVEWKWTSARSPRLIPDPEELQKYWLRRAHRNGKAIAVICGSPVHGYIFPDLTWESRLITDAALVGSAEEIAQWITKQVLHG